MLFSLGKETIRLPLYLFQQAKIEEGKRSSNETLCRPPLPRLSGEGGEEKGKKAVSNVFLPLSPTGPGYVPLAKLSEVVGG